MVNYGIVVVQHYGFSIAAKVEHYGHILKYYMVSNYHMYVIHHKVKANIPQLMVSQMVS